MRYETITLEHSEEAPGTVTLTLNRPDALNAMTPAMGDEIVRAVEELRSDGSVRALIVTGAGKAFCAGGDLQMLARDAGVAAAEGPSMGATPREFYDRFLSLRKLPFPTVAAINGTAVGAGLCLALACDLRVAAARATMGMTFVKIGIHPGMGATFLLPSIVGTAVAAELFFTGRTIDAAEALRLGLVNRVVEGDRLAAEVQGLAAEISTSAPVAVRMLKESIYARDDRALDQALEQESRQQAATFLTADAREGIAAAMERRKPRFEGR